MTDPLPSAQPRGVKTSEGAASGVATAGLLGMASQAEGWQQVALAGIAAVVVVVYALVRAYLKRGQA